MQAFGGPTFDTTTVGSAGHWGGERAGTTMRRFRVARLLVVLMLASCGAAVVPGLVTSASAAVSRQTDPPTDPPTDPTTVPTDPPTEPTTVPPTDPPTTVTDPPTTQPPETDPPTTQPPVTLPPSTLPPPTTTTLPPVTLPPITITIPTTKPKSTSTTRGATSTTRARSDVLGSGSVGAGLFTFVPPSKSKPPKNDSPSTAGDTEAATNSTAAGTTGSSPAKVDQQLAAAPLLRVKANHVAALVDPGSGSDGGIPTPLVGTLGLGLAGGALVVGQRSMRRRRGVSEHRTLLLEIPQSDSE